MSKLNPTSKRSPRGSSNGRGKPGRAQPRYLDLIARATDLMRGVNRPFLSCSNLAHGFAAAARTRPPSVAASDEHRHRHRL
jgi:hypothetical protein